MIWRTDFGGMKAFGGTESHCEQTRSSNANFTYMADQMQANNEGRIGREVSPWEAV
jgi:hypothetical protein